MVNAAGIDLIADIEKRWTLADWNRIIAVNLTGPMLVMQAAFPHLKAAGGGTIVNVSSGAGLSPLKHRTAYCASKAGPADGRQGAGDGGGRIRHPRQHGLPRRGRDRARSAPASTPQPDPLAAYETVRARYALQRIASPEEIAAAIPLADAARNPPTSPGTAIAVDGGRTFH